MSTNGNGKTGAAVIAAREVVAATERPLREQEKRAATTRMRLSECQQALAIAQAEHEKAASRYTDDDSPANKQRLRAAHDDVQAAQSRVRGFTKKLAEEESAIRPLDANYQAACAELSRVQLLANRDDAQAEMQQHDRKMYDLNAALREEERQYYDAKTRFNRYQSQINQSQWNARKVLADVQVREREAASAKMDVLQLPMSERPRPRTM